MAIKKRRQNKSRKTRYSTYRTNNTAEKNKIRKNTKRIYNLVLAKTQNKEIDNMSKLKKSIREKVISAIQNKNLGSFLTKELLNKWATNH